MPITSNTKEADNDFLVLNGESSINLTLPPAKYFTSILSLILKTSPSDKSKVLSSKVAFAL